MTLGCGYPVMLMRSHTVCTFTSRLHVAAGCRGAARCTSTWGGRAGWLGRVASGGGSTCGE
eukprot:1899006-Prymnesium_polylepis.1